MANGAITEVSLKLRSLAGGRKQYVVHAVDLSRRTLLASWLVCTVNRLPSITKAFSLVVDSVFGAHKKVSLANPYSFDAIFHVFTNEPQLLELKQTELHIPVGASRYISLKFAPAHGVGDATSSSTKLLVFVNNDDDKNEECMEITVVYSDSAEQ